MLKKIATVFLLIAVFLVACPCIVLASGAASTSIPDDASVYNGHSYKVYTQKKSWSDAQAYCESLGGHLVTITSQEEQDFVSSLVTKKDVAAWIGASWVDNQFLWVTGEPFNYTNWDQGEPSYNFSSSKEPYVGIYANDTATEYSTTGKWNDFRGSTDTIKGFVCEWEPQCVASDGTVYDSHQNLYWSVSVEPTCTDAGTKEQKCGRCQTIVSTEQMNALNHDESPWQVAQAATCTATGIRQRVCERCDVVMSEETIDAVGHTYGEWEIVAGNKLIPPIVKEHRCSVCSYSESYKDWSYVWIPIVSGIGLVGITIGLINYIKAFKKR